MSTSFSIILVLSVLVIFFFMLWRHYKNLYNDLSFRKNSLSSRYGKMTEQFMPFLKNYPYLPENFRFLGSPIDGVQFEDDKIVFVEFKAADSKLSLRQRQIAELVWQKRVEFKEIKIQ